MQLPFNLLQIISRQQLQTVFSSLLTTCQANLRFKGCRFQQVILLSVRYIIHCIRKFKAAKPTVNPSSLFQLTSVFIHIIILNTS